MIVTCACIHTHLNVKQDLSHESSKRYEELDVSQEPLDGLLEELFLQTNWVVSHLWLGNLTDMIKHVSRFASSHKLP